MLQQPRPTGHPFNSHYGLTLDTAVAMILHDLRETSAPHASTVTLPPRDTYPGYARSLPLSSIPPPAHLSAPPRLPIAGSTYPNPNSTAYPSAGLALNSKQSLAPTPNPTPSHLYPAHAGYPYAYQPATEYGGSEGHAYQVPLHESSIRPQDAPLNRIDPPFPGYYPSSSASRTGVHPERQDIRPDLTRNDVRSDVTGARHDRPDTVPGRDSSYPSNYGFPNGRDSYRYPNPNPNPMSHSLPDEYSSLEAAPTQH